MTSKKLFSGNLQEDGFIKILFRLYSENLTGALRVDKESVIYHIFLKNGVILFANSNSISNSLSAYLLDQKIISENDVQKALDFSKKHLKRFGRSLLELGIINNDTLWQSVQGHLKFLILSIFIDETGKYRFIEDKRNDDENITLELKIPQLLIEGSRLRVNKELIEEKLAATMDVYPLDYTRLDKKHLKPYELHLLELIKNNHLLKDILDKSELLRFDTLKLIDLFLTVGIITNNRTQSIEQDTVVKPVKQKVINENEKISGATSFVSFSEALKFYNNKYELIYKVFSKEIGPIALSILQKSISDISDNLPSYLQKIRWNGNGTIQEDALLKSLYHKDFHENIKEFLTGLEEILYAGIYTIRKNINPEKEQTILKWINRPVK